MSVSDLSNHHSIQAIVNQRISKGDFKPFQFKDITVPEVQKILKDTNPRKASGWDNIPPIAFKIGSSELAMPLCTLYNQCIANCHWPRNWKRSEWVPVYKKDDRLNMENYRPVSIAIMVNKTFQKLLTNQITAEFNERLSDSLTAYRKRYSCETALLALTENWKNALDNRMSVGLLSTDMSKAFDCLHHSLLLAKLEAYGFKNESIKLMKSYFMDRYNRLRIDGFASSWKRVKKGCPQGSSFGPLLWNLFQNDLTFEIPSKIGMYADDHQFYEINKDINTIQTKLQDTAQRATNWYDTNFLKGNFDKYGSMILKGGRLIDEQLELNVNGTAIKSYNSIKLLGVNIDDNLNFSDHISYICKKSSQRVGVINRLRKLIPAKAKLQLFKAAILPYLTYCSIVWNCCKASDSRKLEGGKKRALRAVYCDSISSYSDLLKRANLKTLCNSRLHDIAVLMFKVKNNLCPNNIKNLFVINNNEYNLRNNDFSIPRVSTTRYGKHSLRYLGPVIWSKLDGKIRAQRMLQEFKNALHKVDIYTLISSNDCKNCILCKS